MFKWFKRHEHKWIVCSICYEDGLEVHKTCSICGKRTVLFRYDYANKVSNEHKQRNYILLARGIKAQNPEYYVAGIDD